MYKQIEITQPIDKGILLKHIIEKNRRQLVFERPCKPREYSPDSICHHAADATDVNGMDCIKRVYKSSGKSPALTTMQGGHREPKLLMEQS